MGLSPAGGEGEEYTGINSTTTNYGYDNANPLTAEDRLQGAGRMTSVNGVTYTWDANGNLLNDGVNTYTYNGENRLIAYSDGTTASSYTYNGQGDRLSQTVDSVSTNYTLNLNTGLTQVLTDGENTYLYGLTTLTGAGRLGQESTTTEYFLGDALGSVRQLTDTSGAVTLTKSYTPFGEVLSESGTGESIYGYTGEVTDENGLVFLRARYYLPGSGRFISRDTWDGNSSIPQSYNSYLYGYANPILFSDPSGQMPAVLAALLPSLIGLGAGALVGASAGAIYGACTYEWALAGLCGCDIRMQALSMTKSDWIGMHALSGGIIGGVSGAIAATGPLGVTIVSIGIATLSVVDLIPAIEAIKSAGVTWCTVTRIIIDVAGIALGTAGIVKGVRLWRSSGSPLKFPSSYPAITPPQNQQGLRTAMGSPPAGFERPQAHHNFPWILKDWFAGEGRGINVNDPAFGRWVEGTPPGPHQIWSPDYTQAWINFKLNNPNASRAEVFAFLNILLSSGRFPSH